MVIFSCTPSDYSRFQKPSDAKLLSGRIKDVRSAAALQVNFFVFPPNVDVFNPDIHLSHFIDKII